MNNHTTKRSELIFRISFLFIYVAYLLFPLQTISAASVPVQQSPSVPELDLAQPITSAPGPEPSKDGYKIASQEKFAGNDNAVFSSGPVAVDSSSTEKRVNPLSGLFSPLAAVAPPSIYGPAGGLEIEPITAYNLIVDSNVLSPSSYGPSAATLGAKYCNRSGGTMNNVWAYIGNYDEATPANSTPGIYPVIAPAQAVTNTGNSALATAVRTDYGGTIFSLAHESGSAAKAADASRYIGTLADGECRTVYWLVTYPRKAELGSVGSGNWVDVTGGVKPDDDLWLPYDFWGTVGSSTSYYTRYVTMRNEISAQANKIWPNGDNKVPPEYITAIQQVLGWDTWTPSDPSGATVAFPGETVTSQGIWYDLGNVGAGFDNNYDLVPDRNIWVQPIGDASSYDPGCFRLVNIYGLIIVKLNDGTELLIPFKDQTYFGNIPDNNNGAVGLVFYEYIALDGACSASLTPYQEVASGYDNEKFNGDFGAGIPPLQSQQTNILFDKNGSTTVSAGSNINYTMQFTLPQASSSSTVVSIGNPTLGMPLVFQETIPTGTTYVQSTAAFDTTATSPINTNLAGTILYSHDGGLTYSTTETPAVTVTHIQWWVNAPVTSNTSNAVIGGIKFSVLVPGGYAPPQVQDTGCLKLGNAPCFKQDTHTTLVSGSYNLSGTVFKDDAVGGGTMADGANAIAPGEEGIAAINVNLYYDANASGSYDAGETLLASTDTQSYSVYDGYIDMDNDGSTTVPDAGDNGTLLGYTIISGQVDIDRSGTITTADDGAFAGYTVFDGRLDMNVSGGTAANTADDGTLLGPYNFLNLPAGSYVVVVTKADPQVPTYYGLTTTEQYGAALSVTVPRVGGLDFGFAPPLAVDKYVADNTLVVGDLAKYTINVSNILPGSGSGASGACTYNLWAGGTAVTPPASGSGNSGWVNPSAAYGRPDERYSSTDMTNANDDLGLGGYNIGNMGGTLQKVYLVFNLHEKREMDGSGSLNQMDKLFVDIYYNGIARTRYTYAGDGSVTVTYASAGSGTHPTVVDNDVFGSTFGAEYIVVQELDLQDVAGDARTAWDWTDFNADKMEIRLISDKADGSGDADMDAVGYKIETDKQCSGSDNTLNPVPLVDTFDLTHFDYVSSSPEGSVSGNTITWSNVGALYPGQTKTITVTLRANAIGTAIVNTATSTNPKFVSGAPANDDSGTVNVTTIAAGGTRSFAGTVFDDNSSPLNGWSGAAWTRAGTQTGIDSLGTVDTAIQYVKVNLYACFDISDDALVIDTSNKTCFAAATGGDGEWRLVGSTFTDSSGNYLFSTLPDGSYYAEVVTSTIAGTQKADVNSAGICSTCDSLSDNPATITMDNIVGNLNGQSVARVNFGYDIPSGTFTLGDDIFADWNGDGVKDGVVDEGFDGVTVQLLNPDGSVRATTTTVDGYYQFASLPAGLYTVRVTPPANTYPTYDPDETSPTLCVICDGKSTIVLTANNDTRDFGYKPFGSASIGDTVWFDKNGDGVKNGTGEIGLVGLTVSLQVDLDGNGTWVTVETTTTSSAGTYSFNNLPDGTYRVLVETAALPEDAFGNTYVSTTGNQYTMLVSGGNVTTVTNQAGIVCSSLANGCNNENLVEADALKLDADFGFTALGAFGDTVYWDSNGNGTQDFSEPGINGVVVNLYSFIDGGDNDGVYDVGESFTDKNNNTTWDLGEPWVDVPDGRYGFGEYFYTDGNNNGIWDGAETRSTDPTGVSYYLTDTTTTDSATGALGKYQFTGLPVGKYAAVVDTTSTPIAGHTLTGDPDTDGFACTALNYIPDPGEPSKTICDNRSGTQIFAGTNFMGADFGYLPTGVFGDTLWIDTNGNSKVDIGESGLAGITVTAAATPTNGAVVNGVIYNGSTTLTLTTTTDVNGNYSFQNITTSVALIWTVAVDTADTDFPTGLKNVSDPDQLTTCNIPGNPTCTGYNSTTTVLMSAAGTITQVGVLTTDGADDDTSDPLNLDVDFGYRFAGPTDISGTICLETVIDGVCGMSNTDPSGIGVGEVVYDNVTVYLYKLIEPIPASANNGILDSGESTILVATTLTTSTGDYAFNDVADGTYYIIAVGAPQDGLDLTSTAALVNAGGDGSETGQYKETLAGDGDTLSAFQVVNVAVGDASVVDRDFAFKSVLSYDYGDLPVAYSMTRIDDNPDGARHTISSLYLGAVAPDADGNGYPSVSASNDDNVGSDDEDGVSFTGNWINGDNGGTVGVVVHGSGYLIGWIDLNGDGDFNDNYDSNNDGDFSDAGEWNEYFISQSVTNGTSNFTVDIPAGTLNAVTPTTFNTRFRLFSTQPPVSALAYTGAATGGEVEDYQIQVLLNAPPVIPPHTTPITLSYFHAQRRGSKVDFTWSTATETANIGFNLYLEEAGQLIQINTKLIPSQVIDSLDRRDYSFSVDVAGNTFYIEDVSALNETRRHGPFQLGVKYGDRLKTDKIDQAAIQAEYAKSAAEIQNKIKLDLKKIPAAVLQSVTLQPVQNNPVLQLKNTLNLKVRKTGIYRITYDALKAAGLDLANVPVSKITLTNRGQIVPIYVGGQNNSRVQGKFGPGSFIEFYGEALDTIYTDTNIYTLQVSKSPANRISGNDAAPRRGAAPPASFTDTLVVNNQRTYSNTAPGTDVWYDTRMLTYTTLKSWNFDFQVTGLANPTAPATLELIVWGVTNFSRNPDHHLLVSVNGVPLADETFDGLVEHTIKVALPAGSLREGTNTLQLTLPGNTGAIYDLVSLDKFNVSYQRSFQAKDGQLTFAATGKIFTVTNLPSSNVIVYRIDKKGIVRLGRVKVQASGNTYSATFDGTNADAKYLVTTAEALFTPAFEATRLQADLNRPAQYLIISHPDFIDGIQPLVQARQAQGLKVSVVDVTDLYTQYNYGIFDPQAIQKYISYAKQNLGTQYVLLVGGDTYDYRNYLGKNSISFIPSLYVTTGKVAKFVPVDPLYADLNGDNVPDLAIGRFPVRTQAELGLMVNKTLAYAAKDYEHTAVFASDKYDGVVSFKDISLSLSTNLPAGWSAESIHLDDLTVPVAQSQLIAAMNRGTALVTFTGHSGPAAWTFSNLFNTQNAATLTNIGRPFVVVQWGCWNTYYVDPVNNYLVQSFLFSGDKGAAAVFGAVTLTDSSSEAMLGDLLTPRLVIPGVPMGMALLDAKRELAKTHPELLDVLLGWSLMGDPALVIQP